MANDITGWLVITADEVTPLGFVIEAVTMCPMPDNMESVRSDIIFPVASV